MKHPSFKALIAIVFALLGGGACLAQRQMEDLNRGVVAVKKSTTQIYVSWRLFGDDHASVSFNLYRSDNSGAAIKLNPSPLTATTDYTDTPANLPTTTYSYFVRPVIGGVEQADSETATVNATSAGAKQYLSVPLRTDTGPNGPYDVKFSWVGDLDGDGDYDYLVDRLSTLGAYEQFLEAYTNEGVFLWRMAMGPNSVEQYAYEPGSSAISIGDTDNVTVYDMDGDGKAEVLVRTANGVTVTNAAGNVVTAVTHANNSTQFLSVINGQTGVELGRATMPNAWSVHGTLTNKAMIAYLDGKRPSIVMYGYNRADSGAFYRQFSAFDFRGGTLTQRWTLPQTFPGSEGHQIRIADVDNDGKDEICDLGHVIDDDGTQLFNVPLLSHGDRFHIADIDPDRPGLENYVIQQYNPTSLATALFDAGSGAMIKKWYSNSPTDVGRGIALDLTSAHKGYEMYSTQAGIFNAKGAQIYTNNLWAPEGLWWDGDLAREFIDGAGSGALNPVINKFNPGSGGADRLWTLYNDNGAYSTRQAYGGRPAFWGDILGDWREELVLVASDYSELRVYTTAIAATNRLYTLMHNPQYRCQATTKGYVQASYVDYYLGYNMPSAVPPPAMISSTLTWAAGTTWDSVSSSWKNAAGTTTTYTPGDSVLFDVSGSNVSSIALTGSLSPAAVSFFNPQDFTLDGTAGGLSGNMTLSKSGAGTTTLTGTHPYTGSTTVWDGALVVNGQLSSSPVTVWGGTWGGALAMGETGGRLAGSGTVSQAVSLQYRGAITPGTGMGNAATLTLGSGLTASDGSVIALDLSDDPTGGTKPNDRIAVAGNLNLSGTVGIHINALNAQLLPGTYTLLTYSGSLTGSLSNIDLTLPLGTPHTLSVGAGAITLNIPVTRAPASLTWIGGINANAWDLATTLNWSRAGIPDTFVSGDTVTFDGTGAANPTVNLSAAMPVGNMVVSSAANYTFTGTGAIAGTGGLTKSGSGTLTLATTNSYTGPTTVTGGVLAVDNLNDGGSPSSIGAAGTSAANLVLNGGTLSLEGFQTNTNRSLTLGSAGGTLSVPSSSASLQISGALVGVGSLTKTGSGTLILASANSYSGGTFVSEGSITLASDSVNVSGLGSGLVTLNGGTLSMTNSTGDASSPNSAWSLHVPTGYAGRLNADGRCTLSGALTGGGDFTFYSPFIRTDLTGNWSAFTGRIFVTSDADGGHFRIKNTAGYAAAHLDLGNEVYAFYNNTGSSLTLQVGALSGVSTSYLSGGLSSGATITWQVGARNQDTTFAGAIVNDIGPSALTKVGTGTLTLTGTSSHTGATLVSAGRLQINGSTTATNYSVLNGATLGGSGSITGNVVVQSGGGLEHGVAGGPSLAITGNLTFAANAVVRPAEGIPLEIGTYTLLTYTGTLSGTPVLTWEAPTGSSYTATFNTATPGVITMTLTAPPRGPASITWTGSSNFTWDTTTLNWVLGSVSTYFLTGDTVSFTDSGNAASAITLPSEVLPEAVLVNSSQDYTFSGAGRMGGTSTLTKSGSGTLTVTGIHNTTGAITISGGVLSVTQTGGGAGAVGAVVGTGPITLNGGEFRLGSTSGKNFPGNAIAVSAGSSGVLSSAALANGYGGLLSGASDSVLTMTGPFSLTGSGVPQFDGFDGTVIIPSGSQLRFSSTSGPNGNGGGNTTFQIDGLMNTRNSGGTNGVVLGALAGGGSIQGQSNTTAGSVVYHIGAKNLDTTFSGVFSNGANGTAAINKIGTGVLTLSGASLHTGPTTVSAGKLSLTGSLAGSPVNVTTGGTLGGTGSISGAVTCAGTLAPGVAVGTLALTGGLNLASTTTLAYELGTTSDRVNVTGNLTLDGTVNVSAAAGFAAGTYTLATYTGTLTNNTLNVGALPAGHTATVNTSTAGQVRLVVVSTGNAAPQISIAAAASPSTITTTTTNLSVTATDDGGEGNLIYTWSATGPAAVAFSANGTNSAKVATATFSAPGVYTLSVTASDGSGLGAVSSAAVTVVSAAAALTVNPPSATLAVGASQELTASKLDQFGAALADTSVHWSATGGEITPEGVYTATAAGGPWHATATSEQLSASSAITVSTRSYESWLTTLFTEQQIAAGEAALTADPDHDSLTNLAEYALGTQPYAHTVQPAVTSNATSMSITFQRPAWIGDVVYQAEAGGNLAGWDALTLEVLNPGADPETVRATYTLPVPKPAKSFIRLRFEK